MLRMQINFAAVRVIGIYKDHILISGFVVLGRSPLSENYLIKVNNVGGLQVL